ncbi:hypothetical protein KR76_00131 [Pimelobacter simplex]|uniref:Uncharacterized protein n=1 Tax=Nocardioides simplex TaxID=2045 RepID=A0A0C5XMB2_NOCSI|nr:hypothetical protein KR76_00131 [Pimelobacter simplex]
MASRSPSPVSRRYCLTACTTLSARMKASTSSDGRSGPGAAAPAAGTE